MKDYYKILGIKKNASPNEIRRAFKTWELLNQIDKNKSKIDNDKFIDINEAYNNLTDSYKKLIYDKQYKTNSRKKYNSSEYSTIKTNNSKFFDWFKKEIEKVIKFLAVSLDRILTEFFYFIDKYGILIFLLLSLGSFIYFLLFIK